MRSRPGPRSARAVAPPRRAAPGGTGPIASVALLLVALAACSVGVAPGSGGTGPGSATTIGSSPGTSVVLGESTPPVVGTPGTSGPVGSGSPTDPSPRPGGPLGEAVALRPPDTRDIAFTDWAAMRANLGLEDVTGASSLKDKLPLMRATNGREAFGSGYGVGFLRDHAQTWGWDSFDLDWEATLADSGPPLFVLRFRSGFDLGQVASLLDARGFSTEELDGSTLRSHELTPDAGWLGTTEFAILNTAFLVDGRTLLLSSSGAWLRAALSRPDDAPPATAGLDQITAALEGATAASIVVDPGACAGYDPDSLPFLDDALSRALTRQLRAAGRLTAYAAHGVGYSRTWPSVGRIAFAYGSSEAAAADLPGRRLLATEGTSLVTGRPYAETAFTLVEAVADGTLMTLEVEPVDDRPRRLFDLVFSRDLLFGVCRG